MAAMHAIGILIGTNRMTERRRDIILLQ